MGITNSQNRPSFPELPVVQVAGGHSSTRSPDNSGLAILFDALEANVQNGDSMSAACATVVAPVAASGVARVSVYIRGQASSDGGSGSLLLMAGKKRYQWHFSDVRSFIKKVRIPVHGGSVHLSLWLVANTPASKPSAAILTIDSIDMDFS